MAPSVPNSEDSTGICYNNFVSITIYPRYRRVLVALQSIEGLQGVNIKDNCHPHIATDNESVVMDRKSSHLVYLREKFVSEERNQIA